jgi:hypothetical protein
MDCSSIDGNVGLDGQTAATEYSCYPRVADAETLLLK